MSLQSLDRLEQAEALYERQIDVGLMPAPAPRGEIDNEMFVSAQLVVAMPTTHPLAERSAVTLDMLANEPFVMFPPLMCSRILEIVLSACAAVGFAPRVIQEARQMHTLLSLVDAGLGVTIVPKWVASGRMGSSGVYDVVFRPLGDDAPLYELLFAWRQDFSNPALTGFLEVARRVSREFDIAQLM